MRISFLRYWLPVLSVAACILLLTSLPGSEIPSLLWPHIDKVVHFCMYFTLSFTVARALTGRVRRQVSWKRYSRLILLAIVLCSAFGLLDEWHQHFVPDRSFEWLDWAADTLGSLVGGLCVIQYRRFVLSWEKNMVSPF